MRKSVGGVVGLLVGGAIGTVVGGPLLVVVAAGFGGLAGYWVGSRLEPPRSTREILRTTNLFWAGERMGPRSTLKFARPLGRSASFWRRSVRR